MLQLIDKTVFIAYKIEPMFYTNIVCVLPLYFDHQYRMRKEFLKDKGDNTHLPGHKYIELYNKKAISGYIYLLNSNQMQ